MNLEKILLEEKIDVVRKWYDTQPKDELNGFEYIKGTNILAWEDIENLVTKLVISQIKGKHYELNNKVYLNRYSFVISLIYPTAMISHLDDITYICFDESSKQDLHFYLKNKIETMLEEVEKNVHFLNVISMR